MQNVDIHFNSLVFSVAIYSALICTLRLQLRASVGYFFREQASNVQSGSGRNLSVAWEGGEGERNRLFH